METRYYAESVENPTTGPVGSTNSWLGEDNKSPQKPTAEEGVKRQRRPTCEDNDERRRQQLLNILIIYFMVYFMDVKEEWTFSWHCLIQLFVCILNSIVQQKPSTYLARCPGPSRDRNDHAIERKEGRKEGRKGGIYSL